VRQVAVLPADLGGLDIDASKGSRLVVGQVVHRLRRNVHAVGRVVNREDEDALAGLGVFDLVALAARW